MKNDVSYKYLGMAQTTTIESTEMKNQTGKEYFLRLRTILGKTRLNAQNTIKAINTWAVSMLRYSGGIVKWTLDDLRGMDRKTCKLMAVERVFNQQIDST